MTEIVIEVPGQDKPGYLRRLMAGSRFNELRSEGKTTPEYYENLIAYLLDFISKPENKAEAREALLDASADQYIELLNAVTGKVENPTSPEQAETS